MANRLELTGRIFDNVVVVRYSHADKNGHAMWVCRCTCGNEFIANSTNIIQGHHKSCGCLRKELIGNATRHHGMFGTRFYGIWGKIRQRCLNPNDPDHERYGGRGVTICNRWKQSFENFRDDMYESYIEHIENFGVENTSIDRQDNNGNYEPTNCRWATIEEQSFNKRDTAQTSNHKEHEYWRHFLGNLLVTLIKRNKQIKKNYKNTLFEYYMGCTGKELVSILESKFLPSMTWENHGSGKGKWELDHIINCNQFDLSKESERRECYHHSNLQPMWFENNRSKRFAVRIKKEI